MTLEDRTNRLSQNVGNQPPTYIVLYPRRVKASTTLWQKLETSYVQLFVLTPHRQLSAHRNVMRQPTTSFSDPERLYIPNNQRPNNTISAASF